MMSCWISEVPPARVPARPRRKSWDQSREPSGSAPDRSAPGGLVGGSAVAEQVGAGFEHLVVHLGAGQLHVEAPAPAPAPANDR